jgi:phage minor structural protein, N-terminal domain protein
LEVQNLIYLTNGNTPLNAAYADKISQEANSTYQLTFRFPTSDALWEKLKEETFLTADDLHGEQDFVIFEVQKKHGYIQVYANQSFTLLNNYVINPISLDRATGSTALSRFAGSITRDNPFSFFSDIDERHTFNTDSVNAMAAFTKDKHSILGQWGGDLVRHGYQVRLLKNGGSENESLFMYKKNLSSYKQKTSTKSLKTRITFKTTVKGEGEKAPDRKFSVVVDSPLINKYSQIYEDVIEVNDQDVKDEAGLRKYGEQYFRTTLCDMLEDSLEIQVEGKSDVPVQIFDIVSLFHDRFKMDVRKKITKYTYSPMAKKLLSIGFGQFKSGLSNMLSNAVNDAVKNETQHLQGQFATQLAREIKNADLDFDRKKAELVNQFTDGLNAAKAKAEEVKKSLTETIDQRFRDFDSTGLNEIKQKADEALRNAGAGSLLAQEAKQISEQVRRQLDNKADLIEFQRVKETNKLYERIIGRNENDIADKVARIALTNQLFQVEIGKSVDIHENLYVASKSEKGFLTFEGGIAGADQRKKEIVSDLIAVTPKTNMIFQHWVTVPSNDPDGKAWFVWQFFDGYKKKVYERFSGENAYKIVSGKQHNVNLVTVPEKARFVKISARMYEDGLIKVERGTIASNYTQAPNDTLEAVRTVQTQLAGSWAIQNLTSAGSIISQINATNNQILIEAEKIRLKGKTLLDELTAIDGYFKRLFVGEGNFAKLNAEIIGSKTITADKLIMDQAMARMFVSSDIFTDTLAAKEAFINKLRSVVVTATLLEGYKGRIGGFQIGTHDKDPSYYWLTGQNSFDVGLSSGKGRYNQTSLWVNWGDNWNKPGNKAWFVKNTGEMYCYNTAHFWNNPKVYGNLEVTGDIVYRYEENGVIYLKGYWIYSPQYKRIEESNNYLYLYRNGSSYSWIPMNKEISDRRYKSNIQDSQVSGLDVIENLKTYSYRKEYDGKIEDISCGIMAQDVQKYVPEAFYENPDGAYSYRTFELVPYLIKAIQELNQKIQKLEKTDE